MAFSAADLALVDAAIVDLATHGEVRVRFSDGRETEYRSLDELRKVRELISQASIPGTKRIRQVRMYSEKGF